MIRPAQSVWALLVAVAIALLPVGCGNAGHESCDAARSRDTQCGTHAAPDVAPDDCGGLVDCAAECVANATCGELEAAEADPSVKNAYTGCAADCR